MAEFQVRKDNVAEYRVVPTPATHEDSVPDTGMIRVQVERFAFTANNITYAVTGDRLGYWQFFPATGDDAWGVIPVWGFATVVASANSEIPVGERLFGYFPPAAHLDLLPTRIAATSFIDGAAHRSKLPPAYNNYQRLDTESAHDRRAEEERMLLWPLYITSFCLWDALRENAWYGAEQLVLISASSKTAIGLASALEDDADAPDVIAATSARNADFVKSLGSYRQIVDYDRIDGIDPARSTTIVDMSGNAALLGRLHAHLGDQLKRCINVGLTHWEETSSADDALRALSEFFFAPSHIQQRLKDWGADGFAQKSSRFMLETAAKSRAWLKIRSLDGLNGLSEVYADVCAGRVDPATGLIVDMR